MRTLLSPYVYIVIDTKCCRRDIFLEFKEEQLFECWTIMDTLNENKTKSNQKGV